MIFWVEFSTALEHAHMSNRESPKPSAKPKTWFHTTNWQVVLSARGNDEREAHEALCQLCQTYWLPLYAYVRQQGYDPHEAEDLTQGFFEKLLAKNYLEQVQPAKGKFCSFLLASLRNYLCNEYDKNRTRKRGGDQLLVSWDGQTAEERLQREPVNFANTSTTFDHLWAKSLLDSATARLRQEYDAAGKDNLFILLGFCGSDSRLSHAEIAQRTGLSESAVKATAHRLRQRFRKLVREAVAATVATRNEVDEEIRYLLDLITQL